MRVFKRLAVASSALVLLALDSDGVDYFYNFWAVPADRYAYHVQFSGGTPYDGDYLCTSNAPGSGPYGIRYMGGYQGDYLVFTDVGQSSSSVSAGGSYAAGANPQPRDATLGAPGGWTDDHVVYWGGYPKQATNAHFEVKRVILDDPLKKEAPDTLGHPIRIIDGRVEHDETDLVIPCPGVDLALRRAYDGCNWSRASQGLGPGWTHSLSWTNSDVLHTWGGSTYTGQEIRACIYDGGGDASILVPDGTNRWWGVGSGDEYWSAEDDSTNATNLKLILTRPSGLCYTFNTNGYLTTIREPWGNTIALAYTNVGAAREFVRRAEHSNGQYLQFRYSGQNLVRVETPNTNLFITYAYDANGQLTNATRWASGSIRRSVYDYQAGNTGILTRITDADGFTFPYTYTNLAAGSYPRAPRP